MDEVHASMLVGGRRWGGAPRLQNEFSNSEQSPSIFSDDGNPGSSTSLEAMKEWLDEKPEHQSRFQDCM
jgi:hypothetical protein